MNFATALKAEIARVARKEVRTEVSALKKSISGHRSDIAALKRLVAELQKQNKRQVKSSGKLRAPARNQSVADKSVSNNLRFRPQGLASHRQRLGLSAAAMGQLLGVSGQSVAAWETGKTAPRRSQLPTIAEIRKLGKREAGARLAQG